MARKSYQKVSGVWKEAKEIWIKVAGVWKNHTISYIKVGEVWKQCFYDYWNATLTLNPTSWNFDQQGGNKVITVTANAENTWQASSDRAWLIFSGSNSGTGSGSFTIVAAVNDDGPPDRSGTITVLSDASDATVDITQYWH